MNIMKIIKPIKNQKDYKTALKTIDELWDFPRKSAESGILELLTILVEDYEHRHYPIDLPNPIEAIIFRMEQLGLKRADLAVYLGGKNRVSEILNGRRNLTVKMIKNLSEGLGIPPESLIK